MKIKREDLLMAMATQSGEYIDISSLIISEDRMEKSKKEKSYKSNNNEDELLLSPSDLIQYRYKQMLNGEKTYLEFLSSNPELFLSKRVEWKLNKLIALKGLGKGYYKDYYKSSIEVLAKSGKLKDFVDLANQYKPIELTDNIIINALRYVYELTGDWGKTLFVALRPGVCCKRELMVNLEYCFMLKSDIINLIKKYSYYLPGVEEYMQVAVQNRNNMYFLIEPNYKEILVNKRLARDSKIINSCRIIYNAPSLDILNNTYEGRNALNRIFKVNFIRDESLESLKVKSLRKMRIIFYKYGVDSYDEFCTTQSKPSEDLYKTLFDC